MTDLSPIFLQQLTTLVGSEHVLISSQQCDRATRTTLPQGTRPVGTIRPESKEQVQEILKLSNQAHVFVYPISCGKNWGYGNACAPRDGMLILDLSRMNKIMEVNAELAYAVLEPGVTQGQLAAYLDDRNVPLMLDGNGAGPDASLVGNILERGFGHSRYGDRFSHACNLEAVLADGTVIHTGYGGYPQAQAQHVYKHGLGPSLDGLLSQSNMAVITRMTVWLQPKPACTNFFFISLKEESAIKPFVDHLRELFLSGTLRTTMHCFNDRRLLASESPFPWDQADGKKALEVSNPALLQTLYKSFKIPAWAASGSISGSSVEVAAMRTHIRHVLRKTPGLERLVFFSERQSRLSRSAAHFLSRFTVSKPMGRLLEKVGLGITLLKGIPSYQTLKGAQWRSRVVGDLPPDPLDYKAGLIWVSPVAPMTGEALERLLTLSEPVFHEFGFEFQVTVSCLNERSLCAVMSICFDHESPEEVTRAGQCEQKLLITLLEKGFVPYRASSVQQKIIQTYVPDQGELLIRLKKAWDPSGIVAPGRYIPN